MKKFFLFVALTISAVVAFHLYYIHRLGKNDLRFKQDIFKEFSKNSLQGLFFGLTGAILIQEYNRRRQRMEEIIEFRKDTYDAIVAIYLRTKKVRWTLRSHMRNKAINESEYKSAIYELSEVKATIEVLIHEINANIKSFGSHATGIRTALEKMEDYLRGIIQEYNKANDDKKIRAFVTPADPDVHGSESDFGRNYRKHFKQGIWLMGKRQKYLRDDLLFELQATDHHLDPAKTKFN